MSYQAIQIREDALVSEQRGQERTCGLQRSSVLRFCWEIERIATGGGVGDDIYTAAGPGSR